MKIVINKCFGGFGLSDKAEDLYAEKNQFKLYRYKQTKYNHRDGEELHEKVTSDDRSMFTHTYTKDHGDSFSTLNDKDSGYWYSGSIERIDPLLIEVIEALGDEANGDCASLKVVDIPDSIDYNIDDYDGMESISETHKTWS